MELSSLTIIALLVGVIQLVLIFAIIKVAENTQEIVRILQKWEEEHDKK